MQHAEYQRMYEVEKRHWWFRGKHVILRHIVEHQIPTGRLLDFGCGTGGLAEEFMGKFVVEGVDVAPQAIAYARRRGIKAMLIDKYWQPAPLYDVVIASDVLEHIDDDVAALGKLWSAVKPGGLLIVTVPAGQWLWSNHDEALHHRRRYSRAMLLKCGQRVGFRWKYVSYYNFWLYLPAAVVRLFQRLYPQTETRADTQSIPPAFLNKLLCQIFQSERWWLGRGRFPFGLSLIAWARK